MFKVDWKVFKKEFDILEKKGYNFWKSIELLTEKYKDRNMSFYVIKEEELEEAVYRVLEKYGDLYAVTVKDLNEAKKVFLDSINKIRRK